VGESIHLGRLMELEGRRVVGHEVSRHGYGWSDYGEGRKASTRRIDLWTTNLNLMLLDEVVLQE
jgi:hypothetical protein